MTNRFLRLENHFLQLPKIAAERLRVRKIANELSHTLIFLDFTSLTRVTRHFRLPCRRVGGWGCHGMAFRVVQTIVYLCLSRD